MRLKTYTALTLWVFSSAAFAWQPLTYPIQSQSAYRQSVDNALCFAAANRQTKVDIVREPQIPPRKPPASKTSSTGVPSRPPLPSSSFSASPMGASMPAGATAPAASAPAATTAAGKTAGASEAMAATAASATSADNGASETAAASDAQTTAGSDVKLPPLPAPEPPMTQYWAAYGACMQGRGYVVSQ
jgi:hypothetical protein